MIYHVTNAITARPRNTPITFKAEVAITLNGHKKNAINLPIKSIMITAY